MTNENIDHVLPEQLTEDAVENIAAGARQDFDLLDRLTKRPKRKPEVVRMYTDEETGAELGGAEDEKQRGITVGRRRWGVLGELDKETAKGEDADPARLNALATEAKALAEKLRDTSLVFTLQWIPPIVKDSVEAEAREAIGVTGENVPENRKSEYVQAWIDRMLVATLVTLDDIQSGARKTKLTVTEAQRIREYMPETEYERLDRALNRLLYKSAIAESVTDSSDF